MPVATADPDSDSTLAGIATARRAARVPGVERRLDRAIDDAALAENTRVDDRTRAAVTARLFAAVEAIARPLAAALAPDRDLPPTEAMVARLVDAGVLTDRALIAELTALAREALVGEALGVVLAPEDRSGLVARLADGDDAVAGAARALLTAEDRAAGPGVPPDLSAPVHRPLVWSIAALLRESVAGRDGADAALPEAATRCLAMHDARDGIGAAALGLVAAIDPRPDDVGPLLAESLADARPALFVAALARSARLDPAEARAITLDPAGDRLWLVLRALGLDRSTIARIGLLLAEADPHRDLEAFADSLDAIVAIDRAVADAALAPMRLPAGMRAAMRQLAADAR